MTEKENQQVSMNKDFFDRCDVAIQNGFYLEAVLMEYAAIEARLEAICGIIGLPCGKDCPCRRDITISNRIECLKKYRNKNKEVFSAYKRTQGTKLPQNFFTDDGELRSWIRERDQRVHGLYKDELKYSDRVAENKELAERGEKYARLLFNEAKRINRLKKNHPEQFENVVAECK